MIPLVEPQINEQDVMAVARAVESGWVSTSGVAVREFELEIANYLNVESCYACCSGTSALHLALMVADVVRGDEVIVPTLTFIAPVNAVTYVGAQPLFVGCDSSLNANCETILKFLTENTEMVGDSCQNLRTGARVSALIFVHVFGAVTDLTAVYEACRVRNIKVIEDATEALGSKLLASGRFAGTQADFSCFSFNGNKIISAGAGGVLWAKSSEDLDRARYYGTQAKDDNFIFRHDNIGFNYGMPALNASLARSQLARLEEIIESKNEIHQQYRNLFCDNDILSVREPGNGCRANHWLNALEFKNPFDSFDSLVSFLKRLNKRGIQVRPIWTLNHLQKQFLLCQSLDVDNAMVYSRSVFNVPSSAGLDKSEIHLIYELIIDECEMLRG